MLSTPSLRFWELRVWQLSTGRRARLTDVLFLQDWMKKIPDNCNKTLISSYKNEEKELVETLAADSHKLALNRPMAEGSKGRNAIPAFIWPCAEAKRDQFIETCPQPWLHPLYTGRGSIVSTVRSCGYRTWISPHSLAGLFRPWGFSPQITWANQGSKPR